MLTATAYRWGTLVPVARERPGDGRALAPMRWWQSLYRSVMGTDHGGVRWDVDMDFFEWQDTFVLYRDGRQDRIQHGKAAFGLQDGARIGLRRAHLVLPDGTERPLEPARGTAERWRADLEDRHPILSRRLGAASWTVLVVALALQVPQLVALASELTGWFTFTSPISLPSWLNTPLSIAGVLAGIERALWLRYHWLLD